VVGDSSRLLVILVVVTDNDNTNYDDEVGTK
jgi:hypothetical protein